MAAATHSGGGRWRGRGSSSARGALVADLAHLLPHPRCSGRGAAAHGGGRRRRRRPPLLSAHPLAKPSLSPYFSQSSSVECDSGGGAGSGTSAGGGAGYGTVEEVEAEAAPKAAAGPKLGFWRSSSPHLSTTSPGGSSRSPM